MLSNTSCNYIQLKPPMAFIEQFSKQVMRGEIQDTGSSLKLATHPKPHFPRGLMSAPSVKAQTSEFSVSDFCFRADAESNLSVLGGVKL
jgi:hypothetical protein